MAAKLGGVVELEPHPLIQVQPRELVAPQVPVPAQRAVDVGVLLGAVRVFAVVGGEDPDSVTVRLSVTHRLLPGELVAAGVLRRVHVSDREDPELLH